MPAKADTGKLLAMLDVVWLADADTSEWARFADLLAGFWMEVIPGERPIPVCELRAVHLPSPPVVGAPG